MRVGQLVCALCVGTCHWWPVQEESSWRALLCSTSLLVSQLRSDDLVSQLRSDDLVRQLRSDDLVRQLRSDDLVRQLRSDDLVRLSVS